MNIIIHSINFVNSFLLNLFTFIIKNGMLYIVQGDTTMKERIKHLRKDILKMTMEEFGSNVGLSKAAISQIESGKSGISEVAIKSICREFHINEKWLRTGKGSMKNKAPEDDLDKVIEAYHLPKETRILVEVYGQLNQEHQDAICEYLDEIKEQLLNRSENPTSSEPAADQTDTHVKTDAEHLADLQKELDTRKKPETESAGSGSTGA